MDKSYTQAVLELLAAGTPVETVLANLRTVLGTHGHSKLLPIILKSVEATLAGATVDNLPQVTVATADKADSAAIIAALKTLGADTTDYTTHVDDALIGGFIATYNHRQIDTSYRSKLRALYHEIVAN